MPGRAPALLRLAAQEGRPTSRRELGVFILRERQTHQGGEGSEGSGAAVSGPVTSSVFHLLVPRGREFRTGVDQKLRAALYPPAV